MSDNDDMSDLTQLEIVRHFDSPRETVFAALIEPELLAQWFGPVGMTVPLESIDIDARVGGHQRLVMVSEADPNFTSPVNGTIVEYEPGRLLVGDEVVQGFPGLADGTVMQCRMEVVNDGDGCQLRLSQGPFPTQIADMATGGWKSSFTKLDALLAAQA